MSFATSIQALLGANTPDSSGNVQCAPNWLASKTYIYGQNPSLGPLDTYLAVQNNNTGTELASVAASTFLGGNAFAGNPIGIDDSGRLYITTLGSEIGQIDPMTLTQIQSAFAGVTLPQGDFSGITDTLGNDWILCKGRGGQSSWAKHEVRKASDLTSWAPGVISWGNFSGGCCEGQRGQGIGWVIVGPSGPSDPQQIDLHKVNVNVPGASDTIIGSIVPTDIDAGWTQAYINGICIDQTGQDILTILTGQSGAINPVYVVKLSKTNANVIWKAAMPKAPTQNTQTMQQHSQVFNNRFYYIVNVGGGSGLRVIILDTSSGTILDDYTGGLTNIIQFSSWASNDNLGAVLLNLSMNSNPSGPALRNTTPAAFSGWAILYVADKPVPVGNRRWVAECGPVRVIQ